MAGNQLVIDFEHEDKSFRVVLTATSMDVFADAARDATIRSLSGSEQVEAIIAFATGKLLEVEVSAADGSLKNINRYSNGALNDGPNQEPAEVFIVDGNVVMQRRYKNGELNDNDSGAPAFQSFYKNGQLESEERYQAGQEQDAANGEPAFKSYYEDGSVRRIMRYTQGALNDSANDTPAVRGFYPNGVLEVAIRYKDGQPDDGNALAVLKFDEDGTLTRAESYSAGSLNRVYLGEDLDAPEVRRAANETFSQAVFSRKPRRKMPGPK